MQNLVITISRQVGSGGRLVGEKLALGLGIPFYDRKIIEMVAEKSGFTKEFIESSEERASSSFLFNLASTIYSANGQFTSVEVPINNQVFFAQAEVIRELASKGSCVIVGRCSDYLLREHPNTVNVFIYADQEDRKKRLVEVYHNDPKTIDTYITKLDKGRANYYSHFTGEDWDDFKRHDLCINSTLCGIDGAVEVIRSYLKAAGKL